MTNFDLYFASHKNEVYLTHILKISDKTVKDMHFSLLTEVFLMT